MSDRKDDPAFIYFPTNYRWSMGLLLCLSAAPWGGAETICTRFISKKGPSAREENGRPRKTAYLM